MPGGGFVGLLLGLLSLPAALAGLPPVIQMDFSSERYAGVTGVKYARVGPATAYDAPSDTLVEVPFHQARHETWPGNPAGPQRGILLETEADNFLTNSSFEQALAGWRLDGQLKATVASAGFHGRHALVVSGSGRLHHDPVSLEMRSDRHLFGCLSAYFRGDRATIETVVRPVVAARDARGAGVNLVRQVRIVSRPGSRWTRLAAAFEVPKPGLAYEAGFAFRDARDVSVDAVQLELSNMPWRASSYIPTVAAPQRRGVETCQVQTEAFPLAQGTVALWYRTTNPFGRAGYLFVHGPVDGSSRVYLNAEYGHVEGGSAKVLRPLYEEAMPWARWHHLALSWNGRQAALYRDGQDNSEHEGPFACKALGRSAGFFGLGNGNPLALAAEGLIAQLEVYAQALSPDQILALAGAAQPAETPIASVPVRLEVPAAGRVSVGLYDGQGVLRRQLVLGQAMKPGVHTVAWDGRDDQGHLMPAGTYQARGVVNDLKAQWRVSVGNSGDPPWGASKVRGGLFTKVLASGPNLIASNVTLEGNRGVQCFRADDARVLWTSDYDPVYGDNTAIASDGRFVYVATMLRNEKDAQGRLSLREVIWRLDATNGRVVPWPDGAKALSVNAGRTAPPRIWMGAERYDVPDNPYLDPLRHQEVHDLAVRDGQLYVPLLRENAIRVYNTADGKLVRTLADVPSPRGLAVAGDQLLVASATRILRVPLAGGSVTVLAEGLSAASDVEVGPSGDVLVADMGDSMQVKVFGPDGKLKQTIGPPPSAVLDGRLDRLFLPTGLCVDHQGRIVVSDFGNGRLAFFDRSGRLVRTIDAFGLGGIDGGVNFVPGQPDRLFTHNLLERVPWSCSNIVAYRLDVDRKTWSVAHRWPDAAPVFSKEPIYARRLSNGRLYLFLLTRYPTFYEVEANGTLRFCGALLHPQQYGLPNVVAKPAVRRDAQKLGLLNDKGGFRCRMDWIDANRNARIDSGEITLYENQTQEVYTVNDAAIGDDGTLYMGDLFTSTIWAFPLGGFDAAGNPRYSWATARRMVDLAAHAPSLLDKGWLLYGKEVDAEGSVYLSQLKDNGCFPTGVRLLKFDKDNRLLWNVGRKAVGLKDRPGEFSSCSHIVPILDGRIVCFLEYEGMLDLYTTDGLYLATLLESGTRGGDDSPYSNWGENFFGDLVKDARTGRVFVVINTHNFVLPVFELLGLDTVKRFETSVTLAEPIRAELARARLDRPAFENMTFIYHADRAPQVDGDLADWSGIPEIVRGLPDQEDTCFARYRAVTDGPNLYLAFAVGDPTPARNRCENPSVLWNGDALELYVSGRAHPAGRGQPGDMIVHVAAAPSPAKPAVGLLSAGRWSTPPIDSKTRVWPDGKGYNLELKIPLEVVGVAPLRPGDGLHLDWDLCFDNAKGEWGFKLFRHPSANNAMISNSALWGPARCVRRPGEEYALYARPWPGDWKPLPAQAVLAVEGAEQTYRAELKAAADAPGVRLRLDVLDPDPARLAAAGTTWIGTGDYADFLLNGRRVYAVASPAHATPYEIRDGKPLAIVDATSRVEVHKAAYSLELLVPWSALGSRQPEYRFAWTQGWSDKSGGSIFTQMHFPPSGRTSKLILLDK